MCLQSITLGAGELVQCLRILAAFTEAHKLM